MQISCYLELIFKIIYLKVFRTNIVISNELKQGVLTQALYEFYKLETNRLEYLVFSIEPYSKANLNDSILKAHPKMDRLLIEIA